MDKGERLWNKLTRLMLGLTALLVLAYLAVFISPGLVGGLLPGGEPTPTQAVAQSLPTRRPSVIPPSDTPAM